jgi:AraC-like DNA-binding protein
MWSRDATDAPAARIEQTRQTVAGTSTRGILHPIAGLGAFELEREPPPADLAPFVEWTWAVRWHLEAGREHEQATLPFPSVHLVFEEGAYRVHGPRTRRFVTRIRGEGWVLGVRLRAAGFSSFSRVPLRELVDRVARLEEALETAPLPPAASATEARGLLFGALRARRPVYVEGQAIAERLVAEIAREPSLRVGELARLAGCSPRSVHRLLQTHVGVGTKWLVRRARVQSAAERVARGERVDWAELAHELGYADQSHFIRDFRDQVGETPAVYAARCLRALRELEVAPTEARERTPRGPARR